MLTSLGHQQAAQNYNQGVAANALAPKELGVLQRVEGLRSGLEDLRARIEGFGDRLETTGKTIARDTENYPPAGIFSNLSEAETQLRSCINLMAALNDRF